MRAIMVSASLLGVLASFGLGVVVGRFVLRDNSGANAAQTSPIPGMFGATNEFSAAGTQTLDPAQMLPLPPAPEKAQPHISIAISAGTEADAAQAAAKNCAVNISRAVPIKSWAESGSVSAVADGENCGTALVRIVVKNGEGRPVFSMSAPARDFGVPETADVEALKVAVSRALPDSAVRAAAYPAWKEGDKNPLGTEFGREAYEAVRAANAPVICVKLPSAPQTCLAADPSSGEVKTLLRG